MNNQQSVQLDERLLDFIHEWKNKKGKEIMILHYAKKMGIDPSKVFMLSVMPCTAKKYEITRTADMKSSGYQDVDVSITTRELVRMVKSSGMQLLDLEDEEADSILGSYTGAATIFGATGGVMEAAIRSAYFLVTGKELQNIEIEEVRGLKGVKKAEIDMNGKKVKVAVAHGIGNVRAVCDELRECKMTGKPMPYDFIEVMACEGGCIAGGGQPYQVTNKIRAKRSKGLYADDKQSNFRCSHHNKEVQKLYEEFLEKPLSHKSHQYLHTKYVPEPIYYK